MKAVIFDLYGVLALNGWQAFKTKHFSEHEDIWDQVFELGRKVDAGLADYNELIRFTSEKTGESEAAVRYQLEHTLPNEALLQYIRTDLKPYYHLGILSNASSNKVIDQIFSAEDEMLFDAIVLSHHTGLTKPNAAMYHAIASRLDVPEADCLYFDDQERHVEGAKAAGMQAYVFTGVDDLRKTIGELS
jgi:HAD superfamily hydrolase (TIGR01509 family)